MPDPKREAWIGTVQNGPSEHDQEEEIVTLEGLHAEPGAVIETTNGQRITLVHRADREAA